MDSHKYPLDRTSNLRAATTTQAVARAIAIGVLFVATASLGQKTDTPSFEAASIKPSTALFADSARPTRAGALPRLGPHIEYPIAKYSHMSLEELIAIAYDVKPSQISGPNWLADRPFDIVATMPAGSSNDQTPAMLRTLLETRFELAVHHQRKNRQVMALVVARGGPKLERASQPITPLSNGATSIATPDGPVSVFANGHEGTTVESNRMTMAGLADLLTNVLHAGNNRGRPIVDMHEYQGDWQVVVDETGLTGEYRVTFNSSLPPSMIKPRVAGAVEVSAGGGAISKDMLDNLGPPQIAKTLDPVVFSSIQKLGLKLERDNAPADRLVIDHVEELPSTK